jgi:hypothetical protein
MKLRLSFSYVEDGGWCQGSFAGVFRDIKLTDADMQEGHGEGRDTLGEHWELVCLMR